MTQVRIHSSWQKVLQPIFASEEFAILRSRVRDAYANTRVFPPAGQVFAAFDATPFTEIKVVILGQDPYHGEGQAHGLSFSVPEPVLPPPSLLNIYKEIEADLGLAMPKKIGDLRAWTKQGVLLLNSILTVEAHKAASHRHLNWEFFTDAVIRILSEQRQNLVFMLWGAFAKSKAPLIAEGRHLLLSAAHPSPLSAHNGFFGCRHFSQCNNYLTKHGQNPINWQI